MVINTNISALTSANNLKNSQSMLAQSLARLSSGSKIVSAGDNPAGEAVSLGLNAAISENSSVSSNVTDALSFAQTQDGYLQQIGSALQQMSSLAISAQDVTQSSANVAMDQQEFSALAAYVKSAGSQTFNGVSLFSSTSLSVFTDAAATTAGKVTLQGIDIAGTSYASLYSASLTSGAAAALTAVTSAIAQLATDRAGLGATEDQLTFANAQLSTLKTSLAAANSNITDVDVAEESTNYAKYQVLVSAGTSMLAQANSSPQSVLKLLQ
jgi:flagellin